MRNAFYFAYGSNLWLPRLRQRVPSARFRSIARIREYRLVFCKRGMDGSGKCHMFYTGDPRDEVHGAVFGMSFEDRPGLDAAEPHYRVTDIELQSGPRVLTAFTYLADTAWIDQRLRPFDWYKEFVVCGARQHRLPGNYVTTLEEVVAERDLDVHRAARARALLARLQQTREGGVGM